MTVRALLLGGCLAALGSQVALAQLWSDNITAEKCAAAISGGVGGDVRIHCGMTREEIDLIVAAEISDQALANFFRILGRKNTPRERLVVTLAEIAERHVELRDHMRAIDPEDPIVAKLFWQAGEAIAEGNYDKAEVLLSRAEGADLAAAREARKVEQQAADTAAERFRSAAEGRATRAEIALTSLEHRKAAQHFAEAAAIAEEAGDEPLQWIYELGRASAHVSYGANFGKNDALYEAIEIYRSSVLPLAPRGKRSNDWVETQFGLGGALLILGERESGAARLKEAVAAYRAALDELAREREPRRWAVAQSSLGIALTALGERENDTAQLEEAAAAHRLALDGLTRKLAPFLWAGIQLNLGNALLTLGQRESGTARLNEAVAVYRAALEEFASLRVRIESGVTEHDLVNVLLMYGAPEDYVAWLQEASAGYRAVLAEQMPESARLNWALAQANLGSALGALGERESGTARLEEAIEAVRAALDELTRERVPQVWALAQHILSSALVLLSEREGGTAGAKEAVTMLRDALEEVTRANQPIAWAGIQNTLGSALGIIGEREGGTVELEAAAAACRAALEEVPREKMPLYWAHVTSNLGEVEMAFFKRTVDPTHLERAEAHVRAALEVYREAGAEHYVGEAETLLAEIAERRAAKSAQASE